MKVFTLKWRQFIKKKTNKAILFVALPLILVFFIIQIVIGYHIETALIEMSYDRGQVISEDGVVTLERFVNRAKISLVSLAENLGVGNLTEESRSLLNQFLLLWTDSPLQGVSIADTSGKVRYHLSKSGESVTGIDIGDRDYFKWASTANKGDTFVGDPVISRLGVTKGKSIVSISTPLFNESGLWSGVLTTVMPLEVIGANYLVKSSVKEETQIWLFDENGVIWYSPRKDLIGTSVFEKLTSTSFPGSQKIKELVKESLGSTKDRFFQWWVPDFRDGHLSRMLVTSSSLSIDNLHYTLAVLIPMSYIEGKYELVHRWHTIMYLLVLGMILLFSLMIIVGVRQMYQMAYQKGFVDASKSHKQAEKYEH